MPRSGRKWNQIRERSRNPKRGDVFYKLVNGYRFEFRVRSRYGKTVTFDYTLTKEGKAVSSAQGVKCSIQTWRAASSRDRLLEE